jgi:3-oxoacyl-[acyl-carrier-protein] synthase-1
MGDAVNVVAVGASTPVGRDALSSAAAVRAGVSGFLEHPYLIDTVGEPMRVAMAPWLDIGCEGVDRFEMLLIPAVAQVMDSMPAVNGVRLALALGLPGARPGLPEDLERRLREAVLRQFPGRFVAVAAFASGHAAGFYALQAAVNKIANGSFDGCVIAGVESYLSAETLEWLEASDQFHGAGPLNNAWGFVPGEAAGAVLVMSDTAVTRLGVRPLGRVQSVGTGLEPNRIKTQTVCIGEGLTAAFRAALAGLPTGARVTDVVCDMNGEPYRADEFGFATLRTKESFASASGFLAPAEVWGDVSAASAPLGVGLSVLAAEKGYANGPFALVWGSSEGGERGALLLRTPFEAEI